MPPERNKGCFVVLIGPDGVGKTSLARALHNRFSGDFRYFHFRPTLRAQSIGEPASGGRPLSADRPRMITGWFRLGVNFIRFWLGYLLVVRPIRRRGGLVVGDRWAFGYILDPNSVRYAGPRWLAALALLALPRPDLICALVAPASVIHARKPELEVAEIDRQLFEMKRMPLEVVPIDASIGPPELAAQILNLCFSPEA